MYGLSCPTACGISLDQGLNCFLHWPVDSHPLCHQASPDSFYICGRVLLSVCVWGGAGVENVGIFRASLF